MADGGERVDPTAETEVSDPADVTVPSRGEARAGAPDGADRYELRERLGEGGMGVVWAAHDRALDRTVALKVLHDRFLGAGDQERLAEEARAMAKLSHRNVVAVYDVGEREGRTFLTMELVRGRPLSQWLKTPRRWREVVDVFRAAGLGLAAAHAAGIVHRDVKPSNILVGDDGEVRVADFGVASADARIDGAAPAATASFAGTPAYMPPERLHGEPADARGDQFSFCAALYEALHGRLPFAGATVEEIAGAIDRGPPAPARSVPRWLHAVVERGLAVDPAQRFGSMRELLAALRGPRRRAPWIVGGVAMIAAGATALAMSRGGAPRAPDCDGIEHDLDGTWDAAVRARTSDAFHATGLAWAPPVWTGVDRELDRYATAWTASRRRGCLAPPPPDRAAARDRCLADRKTALAAAVHALARPDAALLERAPRVAAGLPPLADCDAADLPPTARDSAAGASVRDDVAAADVADLTGHARDGVAIATRAVATARATGDRMLLAKALETLGDSERIAGQYGPAIADLRAGGDLAAALGWKALEIDARMLGGDSLASLGRFAEAAATFDLAAHVLAGAPDPEREATLAGMRGNLALQQDHPEEARADYAHAIELYEQAGGRDASVLGALHDDLAGELRRLGRLDEARAELDRARDAYAAFGDDNPEVGVMHDKLAEWLDDAGKLPEAYAEYERALAILHGSLGDDARVADVESHYGSTLVNQGKAEQALPHLRAAVDVAHRAGVTGRNLIAYEANLAGQLTASGHDAEAEPQLRALIARATTELGAETNTVAELRLNHGVTLADLHRDDEAIAEMEAARAIFEHTLGPSHAIIAAVLTGESRSDRQRKRFRHALELDQRAFAIRDKALPAGHPDRGEVLSMLARDHLGLGDAAAAAPPAEQAAAIYRAAGDEPSARKCEWYLAEALWQIGRDRPRAIALARAARAALAPITDDDEDRAMVAQIDRWLAANAPRP